MNIVNGNATMVTGATAPKQHPGTTSRAPILISEHEVVFGTAAAIPLRPNTFHWRTEVRGIVVAAMRRLSIISTPSGCQPHRNYPKRYGFLERSCMGREMLRL